MQHSHIIITDAYQHNLKHISVKIPKNQLTVILGVSGSGKSSLAFDVIYAEGKRRYLQSLSAYARQFLDVVNKPKVEQIEGLSPTIAIEQRSPSYNPRSTVGTTTEIYDHLRLLFARIGTPYCPKCGIIIQQQTTTSIIQKIFQLQNNMICILSPIVKEQKGEFKNLFQQLHASGFSRVQINNNIFFLDEKISIDQQKKHTIEIIVDTIMVTKDKKRRIIDSVETALKMGNGLIKIEVIERENLRQSYYFSKNYACPQCDFSFTEIEPRIFSFNSPHGACQTCDGIGKVSSMDTSLLIPDTTLSIEAGAIHPLREKNNNQNFQKVYHQHVIERCHLSKIPTNIAWEKLTKAQKKSVLYGNLHLQGIIPLLQSLGQDRSWHQKNEFISKYKTEITCTTCHGARLSKPILSIKIQGKNIFEVVKMSIASCKDFFDTLQIDKEKIIISKQILKEIITRLHFLISVGLNYLTLNRETQTLSGGEVQRIHLATQIGSGLTGVTYVLDEPSIGLHQKDNLKLIKTLLHLRDLGNTIIVVEHDQDTIQIADHVVEIGKGAGDYGGKVVFEGTPKQLMQDPHSLTGQYLIKKKKIFSPPVVRQTKQWITIKKASLFNLKDISVKIPLQVLNCVTGVSGSGKSTLINDVLYQSAVKKLNNKEEKSDNVAGLEQIHKITMIDQFPIGRTSRSNPVTYVGAWTLIRELFANLLESKKRGYKPSRFSFNVEDGRCEHCKGDGTLKISMQFLPDIYVECEQCHGKRFQSSTLQVKYKNHSIHDVLSLKIHEATRFFSSFHAISKILKTLEEVGLGYLTLGHNSVTLSGGEAQRVKLAAELCKSSTKNTLYILDEPTTGLHFEDINNLMQILHRLVDHGNTVIVIEHNLDVIKTADWILDLGPEGGHYGGEIIAQGTVENIMKNTLSYTGQFLKKMMH